MSIFKFCRAFRLILIAVVILTFLPLILLNHSIVHAAPATYTVMVGYSEAFISDYSVEVMAFTPQILKVHRGDVVTWQFYGNHNVRFDDKPVPLLVTSQIDGKSMLELNPIVAFPNVKSGDTFKPGAASGTPQQASGPVTFSLVMDVASGTYRYLCDYHPGMVGLIQVVDDTAAIPSPTEISNAAKADAKATYQAAANGLLNRLQSAKAMTRDNTLEVAAGGAEGMVTINRFFPQVAMLRTGQSVTWTVPQGMESYTVNFPIPKSDTFSPIQFRLDSSKMPHVLPTETLLPNIKTGSDFPDDGVVHSGMLTPGQSFTLKFTKPGVYTYYCSLHEGQIGVLIVTSPSPQ